MGSLVISPVQPDFGTHPYQHMMSGSDSHREDASVATAPRISVERASSISQNQPDSSQYTSRPSSQSSSRNAPQRPPTQEQSRGVHPPHSVNQHSNGFDQSGFPLSSDPRGLASSSPSSPRLQPTHPSTRSLGASAATSPSRLKVRDLSHIQSFASEEFLSRPRMPGRTSSTFSESGRQYEISSMPVTDIIEMVAGLLTKIAATNDRQHEHIHRPIPSPDEQNSLNPQASSVLAFHGKNVPSITILSYLSRIHKYCPTTYEVFLSLLVYFDRMTDTINKGFLKSAERRNLDPAVAGIGSPAPVAAQAPRSPMPMDIDRPAAQRNIDTPPASGSMIPSDRSPYANMPPSPPAIRDLSHFFVVDSYTIHRLIIAGVTCASKFFSDVFYTNSRYAKVGGLPLVELNHLELQFLVLNDFRLSITVEELEAYGTMLVEFYAREIVAQQQAAAESQEASASHHSDGVFMRPADVVE